MPITKEYTKEEFWKIFETLPEELQKAIVSEETADIILNICEKNEIIDEKISEISRYIGRVLFGIIKPAELQKVLEEKIRLNTETAEKIASEADSLIFSKVRDELNNLDKINVEEIKKPGRETPLVSKGKPTTSKNGDVYREPIE